MRSFRPGDAEAFARLGQELFADIERLPLLTAVVVDGDCFGGALDLTLAFDIRLATPRARFAHPGAKLGIATGFGGTTRWRKLLGRPAANALFLENRIFSAREALAAGIVHEVAEDLTPVLERIARPDPRAVRVVKELVAHGPRLSREQLLLLGRRLGLLYFSGS